jgi:hypothetical protein
LEGRDEATASIKAEQILRNLYLIEVLTYIELHLREVEVRLDVLRACSYVPYIDLLSFEESQMTSKHQ